MDNDISLHQPTDSAKWHGINVILPVDNIPKKV